MDHHDDAHPSDTRSGRPEGSSAVLFVLCAVLLLAGFAVMAFGFDHASGGLFALGIVLSGLAFLIPMTRSS